MFVATQPGLARRQGPHGPGDCGPDVDLGTEGIDVAINRTITLVVLGIMLFASAGVARAQLGSPFSGTLEPVADDRGAAPTASGTGFLYSVMDYYPQGPKMMVNGTFDGEWTPPRRLPICIARPPDRATRLPDSWTEGVRSGRLEGHLGYVER